MSVAATVVLSLLLVDVPEERLPQGPLERYEPKVYDVTFDVQLTTTHEFDHKPHWAPNFHLKDAPIVMPLILAGPYSFIEEDSLDAKLWLGGKEDKQINDRSRVDHSLPFDSQLAVMPVVQYDGASLRWSLTFHTTVWASRIDDKAAGLIPWPEQWPDEAKDGFKPQQFIESDNPKFKEFVDLVSEGQLRTVPPYYAAKDLVRATLEKMTVTGKGMYRGMKQQLRGLRIDGALSAAETGRGSAHDILCACIAVLRAAEIPARPVIGLKKDGRDRVVFKSWGEFYLPGAGWIPFDPVEMRGGIRGRHVSDPWPDFGSLDDLNEWIPLAYHFHPPMSVVAQEYYAVWGWDPRPGGGSGAEQNLNPVIVSRGPARDRDED